ncbi:tRNA guanosine(34) transglycosylase Tgt [Roseibium album]|uniref:Queuine tRNA-ribosyltransferase n=1 Tax=Roseibium album TaxID=311410 RepID=A0A0M7AUT2_9HYPH|nr:tRNA guanosine(34) transglycosylase Tgt [Roseibium album]CTQ62378.1 Queuine tRNA-ribosyltransferase [Roseibium album]CTQ77990.1 Queuine tRNA-ribosyltransferase [Roseibium album]CTQ80143.1 Queuine tRNA-ribosyltransferase [Roseibium album]
MSETAKKFNFKLIATDGMARRGEITTPHGVVRTPAFMPVGTQATVKAMYPGQVRETGADVVLGNTYHLMLRPTAERVDRLGGLHTFMNWPHTILTDSGGFQVMSLAQLRKLDEEGVRFQSHIDGRKYHLTPERSVEIQGLLGSDIQMQLDECIKLPSPKEEIQRAMELSLRWAERSRTQFEAMGGPAKGQGLYGIVQGGDQPDLRIRSAESLGKLPFEGFSVGGLAVGEPQDVMLQMLDIATPVMPVDKPRYLMGVGTPDDLLESVKRGIDQFDCVMPTRAGRHGLAYTKFGKVNLKNARHQDDARPLDAENQCPASSVYSRAYLHHLVRAGEGLAGMLLTWNNIAYYQQLMQGMRDAIEEGRFDEFYARTKEDWARGDIAAL